MNTGIANTLPNAWIIEEKLEAAKREAKALKYLLRAIHTAEGKDNRPRAVAAKRVDSR